MRRAVRGLVGREPRCDMRSWLWRASAGCRGGGLRASCAMRLRNFFTTQKVFNYIPQKGIERYLQRKWLGVRGADNTLALFKEFVESVLYK